MMFPKAYNLSLAGAIAVAISATLLGGCGGSGGDPSAAPPTTRSTTTTPAKTTPATPVASTACMETITAIAEASGGSQFSTEQLDSLAFAGPQRCRNLADLRGALVEQFGSSEGESLTGFVISACVAGDAWALLGEPSVIADTSLCKEARSRYTVVGNRRLVPAHATFADDFEGACRGWSTDRNERVAFSCADRAYRVLVRNPDRPQHSRMFDRAQAGLSVEADAVLVRPRKGEFEFHGVTCWASRTVGYLFVLGPDGSYAILKEDVARGHRHFLKQGQTEHALPGVGVRNRIRGDCEAAGGIVELALFINGDRVAVVRDKEAHRSFNGFGLFVGTSERGTEVRFDNVLVRGDES